MKSTKNYSDNLNRLRQEIENANAILVGAGSGLSASAGFTYSGERFDRYFSDFKKKYGIQDMYSGGFYPFPTPEEYWAWWSRHIYYNRYIDPPKPTYLNLLNLIRHKDYFVLTTNVDHCFQKAGIDKTRLFYTQGDYGLWQCSRPCHQKTYDNEITVYRMLNEQRDMKVPSALIPKCPVCGERMAMNLRSDETFVQDEGWYAAAERYTDFVRKHKESHILLLELGVGGNTPVIIKYPFWQMAAANSRAIYACINLGEAICPTGLPGQPICISQDIDQVITDLSQKA